MLPFGNRDLEQSGHRMGLMEVGMDRYRLPSRFQPIARLKNGSSQLPFARIFTTSSFSECDKLGQIVFECFLEVFHCDIVS